MSDTFVPLSHAMLPKAAATGSTHAPASPEAAPGFEALVAASADPSRSPDVCAKPAVTLQRNGDVVTGIRVQCGCGRVTELNCLY